MKIIGVTLGWDGKPHLCFEDGSILWGNADRILYPEYFRHGEFPTDPITGEPLKIVVETDNNKVYEHYEAYKKVVNGLYAKWRKVRKNGQICRTK
jgi:hypothetical protein